MLAGSRIRGVQVRGEVLRTLRLERRWSREEAAHRAGVSEKVISKAETGGRIDAKSAQALAAAYSAGETQVSVQTLLFDSSHSGAFAATLLERWVTEVWGDGQLNTIDELFPEPLQYHCEVGCLTTRQEVKRRVEQARRPYRGSEVVVDSTSSAHESVFCRWRLTMSDPATASGDQACAHITTSLQLKAGKICEAREYWDSRTAFLGLIGSGRTSESS